MDVNETRTLDVKRMKLSSPTAPSSESTLDNLNSKSDVNKGDISLVHTVLEDSPFSLDGEPEFGLCLMAKRDLKAGELLFDDIPAFFGPSADLVEDYSTPLCLGCCVVMNDGNGEHRCPDCNWPLCGMDCDNIKHHQSNECALFVKHNVKFPPNVEIQPCYKGIAIIRGLLVKEKNPKLWEQLMTLQWETQLQLTPHPDFTEFKENFGLSEFGDEDDWLRILGIINVNSYSFQRVEKKDGSPSFGECLFPIYSLMCHSCTPNCTWAITYSPNFTMKVRPTVDIKKGEMLSVCYNHEFSKFGYLKRQEKIRERAEFDCKCKRCLDPTDFNTNVAAVKCFKCKEGYMLPADASDYELDWKCNLCPYTMCSSFISSFVESLYEQSDMAEDEAEETGEPVYKIFEKFIEANSGTKVHPNHWVISEATLAIIKLHSANLSTLTLDQTYSFLKHCEYLLGLRDVLAPGFSNERGMLHHYMARGLFRKLELMDANLTNADLKNKNDMMELKELQNYAMNFWLENPHFKYLTNTYKEEPDLLMKEKEIISTRIQAF